MRHLLTLALGAGPAFGDLDPGHIGQRKDQQAPVFVVEGSVGVRGLDQVARVGSKGRGVGFDLEDSQRGELLALFLAGEDVLMLFLCGCRPLISSPYSREHDCCQQENE